jgi:hypothetical protein
MERAQQPGRFLTREIERANPARRISHSEECIRLAKEPGISTQGATILFAMARSWNALAPKYIDITSS